MESCVQFQKYLSKRSPINQKWLFMTYVITETYYIMSPEKTSKNILKKAGKGRSFTYPVI